MRLVRSIAVLAVSAFVIASAPARADVDSARALIAIERPGEAFAQIKDLPERIVEASANGSSSKPAPEAVQALSQAAAQSVDEVAMREAIERVLTPMAASRGADLGEIAKRWAVTAKTVETTFDQGDEEAVAGKFKAELDRRPDKAGIDAIVAAMAAPALDDALAMAARRIERALEFGRPDARAKLAVADDGKRAALIDALMAEGRRQTSDGGFSAGLNRDAIVMHLRARLTLMSPEDLAAMGAFYADPAGRAERDALVKTFVEVADAAQQRMLRTYLDALRRTAR